VSTILPTPNGRDLPWPTVDDTTQVGELLAENLVRDSLEMAVLRLSERYAEQGQVGLLGLHEIRWKDIGYRN
jgi:hypothetical protein